MKPKLRIRSSTLPPPVILPGVPSGVVLFTVLVTCEPLLPMFDSPVLVLIDAKSVCAQKTGGGRVNDGVIRRIGWRAVIVQRGGSMERRPDGNDGERLGRFSRTG
jgi:hypothetical protein